MSAWRKFVAIFLIIVFAPATVLAAIPFELCVGADGHRVIETTFFPNHHTSSFHATSQHGEHSDVTDLTLSAGADATATTADLGCVDIPVQLINQAAPRKQASLTCRPVSEPSAAAVLSYPQPILASPLFDSVVPKHHAEGGVLHDPRLAIRATTVLRN
jgi:hypothetical protein